jgi:hypothetical protein
MSENNVDLLRSPVASNVDLVFFDLPSALDYRLELQRAGEAAERAHQRRFKRELDPLNWGHWS